MPTDPRKRQRKLERRAWKRKEKRHAVARAENAGVSLQLTAAAKHPVLHAWITEDLWTQGMGHVILSRLLPNGSVAVAAFLVDRYCLGVKDAFAEIVSRSTYEERFVRQLRSRFDARDVTPAAARKLVESAVAYARGLGLPPHPDYQQAKLLFGDIDAGECTEEFEFGKDGAPLFIPGPDDGPERCRQVLAALERSCGPGGYHGLIGVGGDRALDPDSIHIDEIDFDKDDDETEEA